MKIFIEDEEIDVTDKRFMFWEEDTDKHLNFKEGDNYFVVYKDEEGIDEWIEKNLMN